MEGVWEVWKGTYQAKEKLALIPNMMYMGRGEDAQAKTHQKEPRKQGTRLGLGWHGRAKGHGQTVPTCCLREQVKCTWHGLKQLFVWLDFTHFCGMWGMEYH